MDVGRRAQRAASRIESGSGSIWSATTPGEITGSLSPWPVRTHTARRPLPPASWTSAASPAAEESSATIPSLSARRCQASRISSSPRETTVPPLRAIAASASAACAGRAMRIALASGHRSVRRLACDQPRQLAALVEAAGVGACVPAAAVGKREHVRRRAQLLDDLERSGLLPLDAVRVERVDEHELVVPGELLCRVERLVEAAADLEQPRAGGDRLEELRCGDAACRDEHDRTQAGPRGVGGCGGGGVPGRRADDCPRSGLERARDSDRPCRGP